MERIFGEDSICSEETRKELKNVMQVTEEDISENRGQKLYFCVHLGRNDGRNVSSTLAKEIAIQIVLDEYKRQ